MALDIDARVLANEHLGADSNIVSLAAPAIASITQPGQFVMIRTAATHDPLLRRPFSVFEILRDGTGKVLGLSLLNKRVGRGTGLLLELEPGAHVGCLGPLGRPFTPVEPPFEAWMVAGGVGLAPFATLAERLHARGTRMRLYYGARRAAELFRLDLFEGLGCELALTTEDGSRGDKGLVTSAIERDLRTEGTSVMIYACGPTRMMHAVARLASSFARPVQVSLEPTMGCGLGGCYSCVVPVRSNGRGSHFVRGCLEGPVFDGSRIVWEQVGLH